MIGKNFDRAVIGKRPVARTINRPIAELERQARLRTGTGLTQVSAGGNDIIRSVRLPKQKARIIAWTGSGYTWQGVYETAGGTHSDLTGDVSDLGGLDKAFEENNNTAVTAGTIVTLEYCEYTGERRFQRHKCP